jgi:serine/threonine-protein kinase
MEPLNESNTKTSAISGFLEAIRSSSILSQRQFEKLEASVAEGDYPTEPDKLASRLVKDGILTEYQARQVLKGKSQSLVFGRYVILDFLGKGGMGKVYKAWHRMMGRVVALKILDPRYVQNSQALARFHREMQLVGRLDHPNVVRAFDADHVGEYHFIAMEFVAGKTLEELLIERGALPPAEVVYFASQAADGLAHAHARGVLHRDIKPSNLLLTDARKIKLLDFGLGTLLASEELPSSLTAAGITVGTPDYISPEQARMVKLDGRSDLYSLGCSMYHLISGQLPFKGESSMDCILGRITGQAVPISEVRPGLPPRLVQSLEKMMATNPDERYQTAEEAAAALRSLLRPKNVASAPAAPAVAASTVTAPASAPAPAPTRVPSRQASSPPAQDGVRFAKPKPKRASLRSDWTGRLTKSKGVLAGAAVGAVSLVVAAILLFMPSKGERPESQQETLPTTQQETLPTNRQETSRKNQQETSRKNSEPAPRAGGADARRVGLVIESPKEGATVGMHEDLTGRIEAEGWPAIFIQADLPGQPWWCQAPVTMVEGRRFTTKVNFGDEFTPSGMKFRIKGVVARTREEALKFQIGYKVQSLPEGLPQSAEVVVRHQ